jgi:mannonate dehydratase
MRLALRWYGPDDSITLEAIRQIPGVTSIVSSLYHVPVANAWTSELVAARLEQVNAEGLSLDVIESIPVHESIKYGGDDRDRYIDVFARSLEAVGRAGIGVVCYNFMPVFDWMRTDLKRANADASTSLAYDDRHAARIDLSVGSVGLPGWASTYGPAELASLRAAYDDVDSERLWDNLAYFLERVVPSAERSGVRLALHPDDPPWSIFGLPRIIVDEPALRRAMEIVDSPANGITFCTGSLAPRAENDLPGMIHRLAGRIHFVHARNVRRLDDRSFIETAHPSDCGDVDMAAVLNALHDTGFDGVIRPDHGRMIWNEAGRPGYGLFDRALGATYLLGLWEGLGARVAVAE